MTTASFLQFVILVGLVLVGTYALYREKDLIKFERKIKKIIIAFLKASYVYIKDNKKNIKTNNSIEIILPTDLDKEYAEMLAVAEKSSKNIEIIAA